MQTLYDGYDYTDTPATREIAQKLRIRKLVADLAARDGEAFLDALRFARENINDLDAIEDYTRDALQNLIDAINDTDRLVDNECRYAVAAALGIENMAMAAFYATL
jgi:hypothetical protein